MLQGDRDVPQRDGLAAAAAESGPGGELLATELLRAAVVAASDCDEGLEVQGAWDKGGFSEARCSRQRLGKGTIRRVEGAPSLQ